MPSEQDYVAAVQGLDHGGLLDLWNQIVARATPDWPDGKAFEYLVLRAFELEQATVQYPYRVVLQGEVIEEIDGAIHVNGISAIAESKDWADGRLVNVAPIAKLRNQLLRRPSSAVGVVFSRTGFTDSALVLAEYLFPQTILLWGGQEIKVALTQQKFVQGLMLKHRIAIEQGTVNFKIS